LVFKLIDHFPSGSAASTLSRRRASGNFSAWDWAAETPE
jgi:hypothetical protein